MRLSKHFVKNWEERVGGTPTISEIHRVLAESVRIQAGMSVLGMDGTPCKVPSIYWHPSRRIWIKLDHTTNTCITVMSELCI